jgi:hypothetical protein
MCLRCGAEVPLPETIEVGVKLPGGLPNPGALAPRRAARGGAASRAEDDASGATTPRKAPARPASGRAAPRRPRGKAA